VTSLRNNETQGVTSRRECQVGRKEALARELLAPVYGWFTEGFDNLEGGEGVARRVACLTTMNFETASNARRRLRKTSAGGSN
jgi:hypothetical protein